MSPVTRWLAALLVRLLRTPSARRVVLRALYAPGREWAVTPPALGGGCLPGCGEAGIDWDGVHYCRVRVGTVALPNVHPGEAWAAAVEVSAANARERHVRILGLDQLGRYHDDGLILDRAAVAGLGELFEAAFVIAGRPRAGYGTRNVAARLHPSRSGR